MFCLSAETFARPCEHILHIDKCPVLVGSVCSSSECRQPLVGVWILPAQPTNGVEINNSH